MTIDYSSPGFIAWQVSKRAATAAYLARQRGVPEPELHPDVRAAALAFNLAHAVRRRYSAGEITRAEARRLILRLHARAARAADRMRDTQAR